MTKPFLPPGLMIGQTPDIDNNSIDGFPYNTKNYITPRTQREAGLTVDPLPDRITFHESAMLSETADRDVFIVAVVCLAVWLFVAPSAYTASAWRCRKWGSAWR